MTSRKRDRTIDPKENLIENIAEPTTVNMKDPSSGSRKPRAVRLRAVALTINMQITRLREEALLLLIATLL